MLGRVADVVSTTRLVARSARLWRIVGDVRSGEGRRVALLGLQIFLLLTAYYLLKTVREPLILLWGVWGLNGQELKVYATSVQALLLLGVLPLYGRLAGRVRRLVLIRVTLLGFIVTLVLFAALGRGGLPIAVPFYMWLGIVSLLGVAQFWSLAVDLYSREAGERLFGVIAIGGSAGAIVGAQLARWLIDRLGVYGLMAIAAGIYGLSLGVVTIIDSGPVGTAGDRMAPAAVGTRGAIGLVARDRYLLLIGALLIIANLVNTQGEYILADAVKTHAAAFPAAARQAIIGRFYGGFYSAVNALALIVQALLVARLLKHGGTRWALFLLPWVALFGYGTVALLPTLVVVTVAKMAENSFDYSIESTVEQTLFLPTRREVKYTGKATVDTIGVRLGDMAAGALVSISLHVLSLSRRGFAVANLMLVVVWMAIAIAIARRHRSLADQTARRTPEPSPVRPLPVRIAEEPPPTRS